MHSSPPADCSLRHPRAAFALSSRQTARVGQLTRSRLMRSEEHRAPAAEAAAAGLFETYLRLKRKAWRLDSWIAQQECPRDPKVAYLSRFHAATPASAIVRHWSEIQLRAMSQVTNRRLGKFGLYLRYSPARLAGGWRKAGHQTAWLVRLRSVCSDDRGARYTCRASERCESIFPPCSARR